MKPSFRLLPAVFLLIASGASAAPSKSPSRPLPVNQPGAPGVQGGILQFGEAVDVPADSEVQGSVVVVGGSAQVQGHVDEDVVVLGGGTFINGPVDGSVFVLGKTLQLGPNAVIGGDLTTVGAVVRRADSAVVKGQSFATQSLRMGVGPHLGVLGSLAALGSVIALAVFWLKVLASFGWALLAFLLAAIFPDAIEDTAETLAARPWSSLAVGVLIWPAAFLIFATLLVTIIGILLIPLELMGLAALGFWGYVCVAFWLGDRLFRLAKLYVQPWLSCLLGVAVIQLLRWIPYMGAWVTGVALIFGVGASALAILLTGLMRRRLPLPEGLG